jgi:phosphoglycolate phosphatase-like HAD superfamily hydrolase
MIALDLDGTILNYGSHTTEIRINHALLSLLPRQRQRVAILTNQGGVAFSRINPAKYPSPEQVGRRLDVACTFLDEHGYQTVAIYASCYHPRAQAVDVQWAAASLRGEIASLVPSWRVYTTERARKPHPLMLRAAGATVYYGDSPEDGQAANAAGVPFVEVPRFL